MIYNIFILYILRGIPLLVYSANCRKYSNFKGGTHYNFIENHFKVTIFPVICRKYL